MKTDALPQPASEPISEPLIEGGPNLSYIYLDMRPTPSYIRFIEVGLENLTKQVMDLWRDYPRVTDGKILAKQSEDFQLVVDSGDKLHYVRSGKGQS
jgi:hypothetical protein